LKAFGGHICFQIKPKVGTVCFGVAASQGTLLLAGGEKGMRYSMPNARIMMNQPQCGYGVRIKLLKFCYGKCTLDFMMELTDYIKKKTILIWCRKRIITMTIWSQSHFLSIIIISS
jgi:hypothetical protein